MLLFFHPRIKLVCVVLWCLAWVLVAAVLLLPLPVSTPVGSDLLGHFLLFAVMAFGAVSFCHQLLGLFGLTLLTMVGGTALEFGQRLVGYRTFDPADLLANWLGAGTGYLLATVALFLVIRPADSMLRGAARAAPLLPHRAMAGRDSPRARARAVLSRPRSVLGRARPGLR